VFTVDRRSFSKVFWNVIVILRLFRQVLVAGSDYRKYNYHNISSALKKTVKDIFCVCSATR